MTTYLIIDDESIAHDIIKGYCDMLPNMQLQKNCYDAIEAIEYLNEHEVDLIFLDLNMPKLSGFAFLKTLNNPPKVIVTTAYKEFALEGYELNIVDYLLKPFSFERFLKAVNKAKENAGISTSASIAQQGDKHLFLKSNKKHIQVTIKDILYLESAGNYVKVVTIEETITVRDKISDLLSKLPQDQFIKVHKSYAVAKNHIKSIEGNRIFVAQETIPVGKLYRGEIHKIITS